MHRKHAVIGNIDIGGRLKTRVLAETKEGESLAEYPLPVGPGEVAFNRIVLSDHLKRLNKSEVKEYTRLRCGVPPDATEAARRQAEALAVQEAIHRVKDNESVNKHKGILVGSWKSSSEPDPQDRHAVYGVWRANGFRLKVVRETREGRFVDGNFPSGSGHCWVKYDAVELEPHLKALDFRELKDYCRVKQYQIDQGETSAESIDNEFKAVREAKSLAGPMPCEQPHRHVTEQTFITVPREEHDARMNGRHRYHWLQQPRQIPIGASMNENEPRASPLQSVDERINALVGREIARAEGAQDRAERYAVNRERTTAAALENMTMEQQHQGYNQDSSINDGSDDFMTYLGINYERKVTGPFKGKLVSQGQIIDMDGEDYVEYRVLTKPGFF